jgi:MoxR-like ATPase
MRIELGYPDAESEKEILLGKDRRSLLQQIKPQLSHQQLLEIQNKIPEIHVSESLVAYIQRLVQCSRESAEFPHGLSPRASIAILRASQAWALLEDRDHVLPDDVQIILPAVVDHRLRGSEVANNGQNASQILLNEVDVIQ